MRFEEFTIEKYGKYLHRTLFFREMPGLVIIYGSNEAGKTTSLSAVSDFLFSIPQNSAHGQVFGYDQIRLRATIMLANGDRHILSRRKGRGIHKTLYDQENRIIEESRLSNMLGTITRARFESLFALGHESLRRGGQQLLDSEGDIGRLIVEAGGGLKYLIGRIGQLEKEADRLFSPRRAAERTFYKAYDAFEAAEKEIKSGLVTQEAYEKGQHQQEMIVESLEKQKGERRTIYQRRHRQSRLERVIPLMNELDQVENRLQAFLDLPTLEDDFGNRVHRALQERSSTKEAFDEVEQKQSGLGKQVSEYRISTALTEAEALVRDIVEKAVQVKKERADRPKRQAELKEREERLSALKQMVGAGPDTDLEPLLPPRSVLNAAQDLISQGSELRSQMVALKDQIEEDNQNVERLQARQNQRIQNGQDKPFGIAVADFASIPGLARALETRRKQVEQLENEITGRLDAIGFQDRQEFQLFSCPDAAMIQTEMDRSAALEQKRIKGEELLASQKTVLSTATAEIERLKQSGEVPTEAAIQAARGEREETWETIRTSYLGENPGNDVPLPIAQRSEIVVRYEQQVRKADRLSDRKSLEAQRIASLELQEKYQAEANAVITAESEAQRQLLENIRKTRQAWANAWPQATETEPDPARLKRLVEERESILDLIQKSAECREELERVDAEFHPRLEILLHVESQSGVKPIAKASFISRMQSATQAIQVHESGHQDFLRDAEQILTTQEQIRKKHTKISNLETRQVNWRKEWTESLRKIGLPENTSTEHACLAIRQWVGAEGILDAIRITRTRLQRMEADEQELQRLIDQVAMQVGFELPKEILAAAKMIQERSESNRQLTMERNGLVSQLDGLAHDRDRRQKLLEAAEAVISGLCREGGCSPTDLSRLAERHEKYLEAKRRQLQVLEKIASAGDGKSLEALREEWGGQDLIDIQTEIVQLQKEEEIIDRAIEEIAGNLRDQDRILRGFLSEEGINRAIAERERAGAELRQIIEEYIETAMAKELLHQSIDRVRREQQDPLLQRAGELFALTTRGAFCGIETDVDGKGGPVVVGRRASGERVGMEIMSDGTRDQLFLAFRLAAIEHYCTSAEPLPFIADDLLVHFDDQRSAATLDLLAEVGKRTQVLLFTHHRSVVDAASAQIREGTAGLLTLD